MHSIFFVGGGRGYPNKQLPFYSGGVPNYQTEWVLHATKLSLVLVVYNSLP